MDVYISTSKSFDRLREPITCRFLYRSFANLQFYGIGRRPFLVSILSFPYSHFFFFVRYCPLVLTFLFILLALPWQKVNLSKNTTTCPRPRLGLCEFWKGVWFTHCCSQSLPGSSLRCSSATQATWEVSGYICSENGLQTVVQKTASETSTLSEYSLWNLFILVA